MSRERDFDEFYLGSVRKVTAQLVALLGDAGEADDAVQEAYARAWQRWDSVSRMDDPIAWVRVVAYRIKVSSWRATVRRTVAHRRHGPPADVPDVSPDSVALVAALRRIPEAQRRAIVLHHLAGLTVEQVAAEVGAPVGTVKARLSRGRTALAGFLGETADDRMTGEHSYA
ncbi:SigE family RNA polymerase sigma factor [Catenulispora yoronensis]|uniref:SigE family RNA polymerase sigma factor n=1 Tax=Catenulispora yoronensis TaxID=450799 RepID=A0ABP5GVB4_9ACTN